MRPRRFCYAGSSSDHYDQESSVEESCQWSETAHDTEFGLQHVCIMYRDKEASEKALRYLYLGLNDFGKPSIVNAVIARGSEVSGYYGS